MLGFTSEVGSLHRDLRELLDLKEGRREGHEVVEGALVQRDLQRAHVRRKLEVIRVEGVEAKAGTANVLKDRLVDVEHLVSTVR